MMLLRNGSRAVFAITMAMGLLSFDVHAGLTGTIATDRLGYDGAIRRYDSLANAIADNGSTGLISTSAIGDRDMSLWVSNGQGSDANIVMGSWWYTTHASGQAGWGNTAGNTGAGFAQLYDADSSTDTSQNFSFSGYNGTFWTTLAVTMTGGGAGASAFARLTAVAPNLQDSGIYHSYALSLVVSGLEGTETTPGFIEAFDHPDAVTGTYRGVFENTTASANAGFYVFDFSFNMNNWAYANRDSLTGEAFSDSYFAAEVAATSVPEPTLPSLLALSGLAWFCATRRRPATLRHNCIA